MDKAVLVMTFQDELEKPYTIKVNDPKEDLSAGEVQNVMGMIVSKNVFPKDGTITASKKAELVKTQTQTIFDEQ